MRFCPAKLPLPAYAKRSCCSKKERLRIGIIRDWSGTTFVRSSLQREMSAIADQRERIEAPPMISFRLSLYRRSNRSNRIVPLCRIKGNFFAFSLVFRF
jgi:hypothetical protein